jgi:signal transduction histidine kinase
VSPPADDRPDLSLHAATLLRGRAERVSVRVSRRGRPRDRFLAEQRDRLAAWSVPVLATIAATTGAFAAISLATGEGRAASVAEAVVAILVGASAIAIPFARRSAPLLHAVVVAGCVAAIFGWGVLARLTGGADGRDLLVVPIVLVFVVGILPMPWRIALALGLAGYAALLVADASSPLSVHLLVLAIATGGVFIARGRHRATVRAFLRLERLSAAVRRMRRVQEQLVVVEKLEALRVLVGGMAHELNNALAISVASNQLAQKRIAEVPVAEAALVRSNGGLSRIRATVDRLRKFAMAADGVVEPADVGAMIDFALESAIGRARSGVIILREYDKDVGLVDCNVSALAEALFQIAKNAVEAMPSGGTIRARVQRDDARVVLSLSDEGRGIPPEQLKRIFDPYWQAASKANKSGMGLSTVYGLVSALGGSVKVASEEGKGTTISIAIPRRR